MKKLISILLALMVSLPLLAQDLLRVIPTTTSWSRNFLTNNSSIDARTTLGLLVAGTNALSFNPGQFTVSPYTQSTLNRVHLAGGVTLTNPVVSGGTSLMVTNLGLAGGRAAVISADLTLGSSTVTMAELAFLSGVTGGIQPALDSKVSAASLSISLSAKADLLNGKVPGSQLPGIAGIKHDLSKVSNPTPNDTLISGGWSVGSIWINVANGTVWQCVNSGLGAPSVWRNLSVLGTGDVPGLQSALDGKLNIENPALTNATLIRPILLEGAFVREATNTFGYINSTMGVTVIGAGVGFVSAPVAGQVFVPATKVTAKSRIFITGQSDAGTPGWLRVSSRTPGSGFTITSSSNTDSSSVAWVILEPAP